MNYYAQVINIIMSDRNDWHEIVVKIAQKHPKIVIDASKEDWKKEAAAIYKTGDKLSAIKLWRNNTGASLKDAKEALDALGNISEP